MATKEELREAYNDFGWTIKELSGRHGISEEEVRSLLGKEVLGNWKEREEEEKATGKTRMTPYERKFRTKALENMRARRESEKTIDTFRNKGCTLSRCSKCGAIMDDARIVEDEEEINFYYECSECGFVDWKDKCCKDKCCREGLARLVSLRYGEGLGIDEDTLQEALNDFIETGNK